MDLKGKISQLSHQSGEFTIDNHKINKNKQLRFNNSSNYQQNFQNTIVSNDLKKKR